MKKRLLGAVLVSVLAGSLLAGCAGSNSARGDGARNGINVLSREDGSGTRSAFIELFGIEQENADGRKMDLTTDGAQVTNSTAVMMTTVSQDVSAIGYISLGSLNDTVKAAKIDGSDATPENVKSGAYKVSRPFNIVTKEDLSETAQDFVDFIMSAEGLAVVEEEGYISVDGAQAYAGSKPAGKVVVAGSSSVAPVMEKLSEAYMKINTDAEIEVQQSDSTTGINSADEGLCDIGMASRSLQDSEQELGLVSTVIATDGIAVIINKDNEVSDLTSDQVREIYTGEVTKWSDLTE